MILVRKQDVFEISRDFRQPFDHKESFLKISVVFAKHTRRVLCSLW
jgi:hypothetical protein